MFVGGVLVDKIIGLMKGYSGSCNKYKTHSGQDNGDVESAFYLTSNSTNLLLKPLVSLTIGYAIQTLLLHIGRDLSKDAAMAIMDEVNRTANNSTE